MVADLRIYFPLGARPRGAHLDLCRLASLFVVTPALATEWDHAGQRHGCQGAGSEVDASCRSDEKERHGRLHEGGHQAGPLIEEQKMACKSCHRCGLPSPKEYVTIALVNRDPFSWVAIPAADPPDNRHASPKIMLRRIMCYFTDVTLYCNG